MTTFKVGVLLWCYLRQQYLVLVDLYSTWFVCISFMRKECYSRTEHYFVWSLCVQRQINCTRNNYCRRVFLILLSILCYVHFFFHVFLNIFLHFEQMSLLHLPPFIRMTTRSAFINCIGKNFIRCIHLYVIIFFILNFVFSMCLDSKHMLNYKKNIIFYILGIFCYTAEEQFK